MKNLYLFLLPFFMVFFYGCNTTTALNHFEKNKINANAIQYTKKRDLVLKNEIKAMIFATYLNKIDKKYNLEKLDSFIIGIHYVNRNNHQLIENRFKLFMNDKEPKSITEIDKNSDLVKNIPLRNSWANYYLIHFDNIEKVYDLKIKLIHPVLGQTSLSFQK